MQTEDATELMIRFTMPVAAGGSIFLLTFFFLIFLMDKYIFNIDTGGPILLFASFGLIVLAILYCFHYSNNRLGYFTDPEKKLRHIFLLVIIPTILGTALGYRSYEARMTSFKKTHLTEELNPTEINRSQALKIAEENFLLKYGEEVLKEKPWQSSIEKDVWTVTGNLKCPEGMICKGGAAKIKISAKDGSVLNIDHEK